MTRKNVKVVTVLKDAQEGKHMLAGQLPEVALSVALAAVQFCEPRRRGAAGGAGPWRALLARACPLQTLPCPPPAPDNQQQDLYALAQQQQMERRITKTQEQCRKKLTEARRQRGWAQPASGRGRGAARLAG